MLEIPPQLPAAESPASCIRMGWVNRQWRCVKRKRERTQDGGIITVITAKSEDAVIYTDLLTADYQTGTSVTNSIQSEAPEPPTAFTATPQPQEIEFTWTLGDFWTRNGITELWEHTAATPFSSATRIWQGRGTRAVITKSDTTQRFYWVSMRTVAGQVSAALGATLGGNGLAAAALKVRTIDIDPNAATVPLSATDAGPINIDLTAPATNTSFAQVKYVTVTIADTYDFEISASFRLGINGNPGSFTVTTMPAIWNDGTTLQAAVQGIDKTTNLIEPQSITGLISRPAGTYRVGVACTIAGDGVNNFTAGYRDINLRVTVIKR